MECGYSAETGPPAVIEQAPAAERREHWWPGAVAIIVTAGLHVALPARYRATAISAPATGPTRYTQ